MSKSLPMSFLLSGFSTITIPRFLQFRPCPRSALFLFQKKSDFSNFHLVPPFSFQHISITRNLEFSHVHDLGFLPPEFSKQVSYQSSTISAFLTMSFLFTGFHTISIPLIILEFSPCTHDPAFFPKGFKQVSDQSSMSGFRTISFLPSNFNPISPDFLNFRHVHDPAFLTQIFKQVSDPSPCPCIDVPPFFAKFASTPSHSRKRERATSF